MNKYVFGFIGCGNMGGALISASAKVLNNNDIAVYDTDLTKSDNFKNYATVTELSELLNKSQYVFLGVKPQVLTSVLNEINSLITDNKPVFVSMAAGKSISEISSILEKKYPIIRIMPNTPTQVGEGMILLAKNELVSEQHLKEFSYNLSNAGIIDIIDESLIDAGGAVSGCGPAFAYMFADALANGGINCGLPKDKALLYSAKTILGAAKMILETGNTPDQLKDAVCSPGGTTIEGVKSLEFDNLNDIVAKAVKASYDKTFNIK